MAEPLMELYERMCRLIETDPSAFFAERQRLINEAIEAVPIHLRPSARRMQDEVDFIRAEKTNPEAACRASAK